MKNSSEPSGGYRLNIVQYVKQDYVLYFGRFSEEKGVQTLVDVCRELPDITFLFAGKGPLDYMLKDVPNIHDLGFQSQDKINGLIANAKFVVAPSEVYETFGLSVMESISQGTPVIGADLGGIQEIITESRGGILFNYRNKAELYELIESLWKDSVKLALLKENCKKFRSEIVTDYADKLLKKYYADEG